MVVRPGLIVRGDAAATAANVAASEPLFRLAIAADLLAAAAYLCVAAILRELLRPVSAGVSLLAAFFCFTGCTIAASSAFGHGAALLFYGGGASTAFGAEPLQALALVALRLAGLGTTVAMLFFGLYLMLLGYLILKCGFLPRALGVLLLVAGPCFAANSLALLLVPPLAGQLTWILAPGFLAEGGLALWLLLIGLDEGIWLDRADRLCNRRSCR
jgi:hypothetical protein